MKKKSSTEAGQEPPVVKELMEMGFDKPKVLEALNICDGNKEHALNYLMSGAGSGGASPARLNWNNIWTWNLIKHYSLIFYQNY